MHPREDYEEVNCAESQPDGKRRKVEVPPKTRGTKKADYKIEGPAVPGRKYKKGELDPNFGLYVGRPFYAVSRLSRGRYLDIVGNLNLGSAGRQNELNYFRHQ